MKKIIPSLPKGTSDYSPDEMKKREYLFEVFKYNFKCHEKRFQKPFTHELNVEELPSSRASQTHSVLQFWHPVL